MQSDAGEDCGYGRQYGHTVCCRCDRIQRSVANLGIVMGLSVGK